METKSLYALNREGTCQLERFPEALSDGYVKIDERSLADLVRQSAEYARYVKYYNAQNIDDGEGWQAFFEEIYDYDKKQVKFSSIEDLEKEASTSPHLALFLAFLRLFGIAQENLNTLTKRHLDFYYREILQIKPRPEKPDSVPLFFELSKPAQQARILAGALFDAGQDKNGKPLCYAAKNDLIVNKATIEGVKGLFQSKTNAVYVIDNILTAPRAGSSDSYINFLGAISNKPACYGFAIASPVFYLKDGTRIITINHNKKLNFSGCFKIQYSSEKGWEDVSEIIYNAGKISITIIDSQPPFVPYNESIHHAGLGTVLPVLRLIKKEEKNLSDCCLDSSNITSIIVQVFETQDFIVRGDNGVLNHRQAFLPFGSNPVIGASLRIENSNIFNEFNTFDLNITWKGPDDLYDYYKSYVEGLELLISASTSNQTVETKRKNYFNYEAFNTASTTQKNSVPIRQIDASLIAKTNNSALDKLAAVKDGTTFREQIAKTASLLKPINHLVLNWKKDYLKNGYIETVLDKNMGHLVFSNIYAAVAMYNATHLNTNPLKQFPNPPYTPEITKISLNYSTKAIKPDYTTHEIFSIHPFGNRKLSGIEPLLETAENEGELLIGIGNMDKPSVLSLYFCLGEANNPQKIIGENRPDWYYLEDSDWKPFEKSEIIGDSANNFTRSGVVYLNIPSGAFSPHSLMPDGKVWLRLVFKTDSDAFPVLENLATQAVEASFVNQDNELSHLEKGIPAGTISKPVIAIQGIKSVAQPYPSHDGRGLEDNNAFYTRISERLRHKNRVWNVWDYERMILENFPQLFKVKCISNSDKDCVFKPGNVFVVIIPDCKVIPQKDIYAPRASVALIAEVRSFIQSHGSPFAEVEVDNPQYEQIQVRCSVVYTKACSDQLFYNKQLNEDLKKFLAPWTNDSDTIDFCRTLSKSQILYFIEKRPYVDYIGNLVVTLDGNPVTDNQTIQPSGPKGILTTSLTHAIINPTIIS